MVRTYVRVLTAIPEFWDDELKRLFGLWLQDMRSGLNAYTLKTCETFEHRFIRYTRRQFEGLSGRLTITKAFDLQAVYTGLLSYGVENYSNRHNQLYAIISFAKFLVRLGLLEETVLPKLRAFRPRRVIPPRRTVLLEESEVDQIRKAIAIKRYISEYSRILDRTLLETFIQTGLRLAELCNLNLTDVDLVSGIIHVRQGKGRKDRKLGITQGLTFHLERYEHYRRNRSVNERQAFFINRRGNRLRPTDVDRRIQKLSKLAGIEITPHGLRRTFATMNANAGRPLNMLQLALGHEDIRTTQEYLMTEERQVITAMKEW